MPARDPGRKERVDERGGMVSETGPSDFHAARQEGVAAGRGESDGGRAPGSAGMSWSSESSEQDRMLQRPKGSDQHKGRLAQFQEAANRLQRRSAAAKMRADRLGRTLCEHPGPGIQDHPSSQCVFGFPVSALSIRRQSRPACQHPQASALAAASPLFARFAHHLVALRAKLEERLRLRRRGACRSRLAMALLTTRHAALGRKKYSS